MTLPKARAYWAARKVPPLQVPLLRLSAVPVAKAAWFASPLVKACAKMVCEHMRYCSFGV